MYTDEAPAKIGSNEPADKTENPDHHSSEKRRWHDNRGELSEAFDLLEHIPTDTIPLIADGIIAKAEKDFNAGELLTALKSMGSEKIMALHKSKKRQRSYDHDPNLTKIVNYFFVLPADNQDKLATQFLEFTELVVEYMATCDSFDIEPDQNQLAQLRDLFVETGSNSARDYLEAIHKPYHDAIQSDAPIPIQPTEPSRQQIVGDSDGGMKIKKQPD